MREASLERKLLLAVKKAGGLCIKLPAAWYRGIPDRMILLPGGRIFFVELKVLKGRTTPHQEKYIFILTKLGFKSDIIKGPTQLQEFIDAHIQDPIQSRDSES